jgi:hypothetical protein
MEISWTVLVVKLTSVMMVPNGKDTWVVYIGNTGYPGAAAEEVASTISTER